DHTYFYSINGTDEELKALVDKSSPLMEVLGLTPKEISQTLIDTLLKMMNGTTPAYGSYTYNVPDKPIPADCAAANTFNKVEYLATQDLPCQPIRTDRGRGESLLRSCWPSNPSPRATAV